MPLAIAAFGSLIVTVLAIDDDIALVGLVEAVEDRHQRRFTGAVFTDNAVDGALADGQVDILVGMDKAEALVDTTQLNGNIAHIDPCSLPAWFSPLWQRQSGHRFFYQLV